MGLFDLFKKPARSPLPAISPLLRKLIERYTLKITTPAEASLMGDWWEGRHDGRLIAFDERGGHLFLYLGEPAEVTEILLVTASPGESRALSATRRHIERIAGTEGAALAARFRLGASPAGEMFDMPALRLSSLRDGLPRLSAAVHEVSIFDNMRGLVLTLDVTTSPETIAVDIEIALAVLRDLESMT